MGVRFDWDEVKNRSNYRKHGDYFETATLVFDDPDFVMAQDREVDGEERWHTIGLVEGLLLLLVAHTIQDEDGEESVRIFRREKQRRARGDDMKMVKVEKAKKPRMVTYRYEPGSPLTAKQKANLAELAQRPEHEIDLSDIPEWTDAMWKDAVRGRFYRPVKKAVSLRLDADVIAWLKKDGKGYQSRANRLLREKMLADKAS